MTNNPAPQTGGDSELAWDTEATTSFQKFPKSIQDTATNEFRSLKSPATDKKLVFDDDGIRYSIVVDVVTTPEGPTVRVKRCKKRHKTQQDDSWCPGNSEIFPHDTTADQWFTQGQFAAYTELGRIIGRHAVQARRPG